MEAVAGSAAYGEAIVFLGCFRDFPDPRQRGKVIYPLEEVLLLCLLAVLAGAETFVDIARFGQKKIAFLRRFLPFRDGTPSHDHLGDIFATLDATEFQRRFVAWVAKLIGVSADVVAIDGKTLRGSAHKKGLRNPGDVQLARCSGLVRPIDPGRTFDVAVIGAGPAGLATALYAGSEGLSVLVLD